MTNTLPTVDTQLMRQLVKHIEFTGVVAGWDAEPALMVMWDSRVPGSAAFDGLPLADRTLAQAGPYRARPCVPGILLSPHAVEGVWKLAHNLVRASSHPIVTAFRVVLSHPGLLGFALRSEAWMAEMSPAEREADGRKLADIPNSKELRVVCAATVDQKLWQYQRIRGTAPQWIPDEGKIIGACPESLLAITNVLTNQPTTPPSHFPSGWSLSHGTANNP